MATIEIVALNDHESNFRFFFKEPSRCVPFFAVMIDGIVLNK